MSFECTNRASSWRSRFSSRIFSEYGSLATFGYSCSSLFRLKISTDSLASVHCVQVPKEFVLLISVIVSNQRVGRVRESRRSRERVGRLRESRGVRQSRNRWHGSCPIVGHASGKITGFADLCEGARRHGRSFSTPGAAETDQRFRSSQTTFRIHRKNSRPYWR